MSDPAIVVEHLDHSFREGELERQVLFDVSTDVRAGEIVILTGPSGSGKTTLLTLMGALRSTQVGSLRVLGRELRGASEADLAAVRKRIGYVFQAHNLLEALSAQQNVLLSLELFHEIGASERHARAVAALAAVGLGERLEAHPGQLSGGQRQRVAIARALARRPQILLADEPTASLDRETGRAVVELIESLARKEGVTVVLVTHDNRILDLADRILALEDGRLTSLMGAVAVDTDRMMRTLADEIRKGELTRRIASMGEPEFRALLDGVTAETQKLLGIVETVQGEAFGSILGQVVDAYTAKVAELVGANRVRLLFLGERHAEPWSIDRCPHGRPREVAAAWPAAAPDASVLRVAVADAHGREFAVVEAVRTRAAQGFSEADEKRLREFTAGLSVILESWWRMGCTCRADGVGRVPPCCAGES